MVRDGRRPRRARPGRLGLEDSGENRAKTETTASAKTVDESPELKPYTTISGRPIEPLYRPEDVKDVDYDRDPFEIAFNPSYLAEGLQNFEGSAVKMSFTTSAKPGLITSDGDEGYRYLIMPLRV